MSNTFSSQLIAQMYCQDSGDPFLTLLTLEHSSFSGPIYLVNNSVSITSRGNVYEAFPVRLTLPADDGETERQVSIEFDNVSRELITLLRSISNGEEVRVKLEMILASIPNAVQYSLEELKILSINYNQKTINAILGLDDFLNTELSSERYTPTLYPGIF